MTGDDGDDRTCHQWHDRLYQLDVMGDIGHFPFAGLDLSESDILSMPAAGIGHIVNAGGRNRTYGDEPVPPGALGYERGHLLCRHGSRSQ